MVCDHVRPVPPSFSKNHEWSVLHWGAAGHLKKIPFLSETRRWIPSLLLFTLIHQAIFLTVSPDVQLLFSHLIFCSILLALGLPETQLSSPFYIWRLLFCGSSFSNSSFFTAEEKKNIKSFSVFQKTVL